MTLKGRPTSSGRLSKNGTRVEPLILRRDETTVKFAISLTTWWIRVIAMWRESISEVLEANEKPQHASDPREQKYPAKFLAGYQIVGKIAENWGSVLAPSEA